MDQRDITFGMQFSLSDAVRQLENVQDHIDQAKDSMYDMEAEASEMGSRMAAGAGTASAAMRDVAGSTADIGSAVSRETAGAAADFRKTGREAETFGAAVVKSAVKAAKEYGTLPKTIKAGMQGALGYAEKRVTGFVNGAAAGARKMGKAFHHPVQTIKGEVIAALEKAEEKLNEVGSRTKQAKEELEDTGDEGKKAGTSIKDALGSAAGKLVALTAGIELAKQGFEAVKNLAGSMLETGRAAETVNRKFEAVFSDSGVQKWAANYSDAVHRSESEIKEFLVSNRALASELKLTGEAADQFSKITTSMAYDLGAAFGIDDAEALGVVQEYLGGNTAALAEYGVMIDDTALKQAAANMGIQKGIEDLDEATAAQVRMNALLDNSTSIQRQAADAQAGYSNSIKSVKSVMTDLAEKAASRFQPAFEKTVNAFMQAWPRIEPALLKFFDGLSSGLSNAAPLLVNLATTALPPLIDALSQAFEAGAPIGGVLLDLATTALPPLISALAPVVKVIAHLAETVLPPFGRIIGMIGTTLLPPLTKAVDLLISGAVKPLMPLLETCAKALLPILESGIKAIMPLIEALLPILEPICTIIGKIVGFIGKIAGYAASGIGALIGKVAELLGGEKGAATAGADIPHNAAGTDNFSGGWTHINENGGEIAFLPSGSQIIPADKSEKLIKGMPQPLAVPNWNVNIVVQGNADRDTAEDIAAAVRGTMKKEFDKWYRAQRNRELSEMAIQEAYT